MKLYDNVYRLSMTVTFLVFILLIVLSSIITPDRTFSETENRILQEKPQFSYKALLSGKFLSNYEKYISDQIFMRDIWIKIKTTSQGFLGKKDSNGVYLGKDGQLLQAFDRPDMEDVRNKLDQINTFGERNKDRKIYFTIVADSVKILEKELPLFASPEDQTKYIDRLKNDIGNDISFIDLYDTLMYMNHHEIFYKTDHHWTTKGAYYAYKKMSNYMGFNFLDEDSFDIREVTDEFYGSLYSKSGFRNIRPDRINLYIPKVDFEYEVFYLDKDKTSNSLYEMDNLNKKDKYAVFLDGNHSLIRVSTNNNCMRNLLIVRDSFANSILPFMVNHYSEIYLVDLRYFNESLTEFIKKHNIGETLIIYSADTFFKDESINRISW